MKNASMIYKFLFGSKLKKASENALWLFADKILRYAAALFVSVWVARYLGEEQFGIFSYALAYTSLFGILSRIGFRRVVVRELINNSEQKDKIIGSTFLMMFSIGIFFWILASASIFFLNPADRQTFLMVAIISFSFIFRPAEVVMYVFEAKEALKYPTIVGSIVFIIISLLKILLIFLQAGLIAFSFVLLLEAVFTALGYIILSKKFNLSFNYRQFDKSIAISIFKESYPLVFAGLMITINSRIDQIMLRPMTSEAELGWYAIAVRLVEIWFFVPQILKVSIFPNLISIKKQDHRNYIKRLQMLGSVLNLFSYSIIIFYLLFGKSIVLLLYGEPFKPAAEALLILPFILPFISMNNIKNSYLIIGHQTHYKLIFSLSAAIINVIANLMLIPKYGMIGACYASLLSFGISSYIMSFFFPKLHELHGILTRSLLLIGLKDLWKEIKIKIS